MCRYDIFRALINSRRCRRQGGEIFIFVFRRRNISFTNQERETNWKYGYEQFPFTCEHYQVTESVSVNNYEQTECKTIRDGQCEIMLYCISMCMLFLGLKVPSASRDYLRSSVHDHFKIVLHDCC